MDVKLLHSEFCCIIPNPKELLFKSLKMCWASKPNTKKKICDNGTLSVSNCLRNAYMASLTVNCFLRYEMAQERNAMDERIQ